MFPTFFLLSSYLIDTVLLHMYLSLIKTRLITTIPSPQLPPPLSSLPADVFASTTICHSPYHFCHQQCSHQLHCICIYYLLLLPLLSFVITAISAALCHSSMLSLLPSATSTSIEFVIDDRHPFRRIAKEATVFNCHLWKFYQLQPHALFQKLLK